ncbi:uncharacterized protein LOC114746714 [Neltuma alba]|uniref:uncharacterized protein LOC114746714 n=1 Tax=Neltuma alba TaxID=207710 RepID=UPI0010A37B6A|nr:uncharacterized protein LOC114746714 [Prosopis alba]
MEGRRRMTLYDQMSAVDGRRDSLAGSTLEAVMASHKIASESSRRQFSGSRTLSDIIRGDNSNTKDKKSWKIFKDKLWLKRAGSAWFSTINIPALDISIPNRNNNNSDAPSTSNPPDFSGPILARARSSLNDVFSSELRPQTSRSNSFRRDGAVTFRDCLDSDGDGSECDDWDPAREGTRRLSTILSEERALSEREAETAAAASSAAVAAQGVDEPVRMSLTLMDLLEETDRQMGFDASRYRTGYEDDDEEVYQRIKMVEKEEEEEEEDSKRWSIQENCCVCMVRHKGAAFIPCGHTFCRQCSRELWVSRGHCPLCNNVILEILDLF